MNDIINTSNDDSFIKLLVASLPDGIEQQEAQGQRELVNSTKLPTKTNFNSDADFENLGFTFGEQSPNDDLFRDATLPEGWKKEGSDHSMWSYIVDDRDIRRVSVFYKAAFYDRDAFMSLINVGPEFVSNWVYTDLDQDEVRPEWDERYTAIELDDAIRSCNTRVSDEYIQEDRKQAYRNCLAYLESQRP